MYANPDQCISSHTESRFLAPLRMTIPIGFRPSAWDLRICANMRQNKRRRSRVDSLVARSQRLASLLRFRILLGFADGDGFSHIADLEAGEAAD